jgi:YggT family protein
VAFEAEMLFVGAGVAILPLLADVVESLQRFIDVFLGVYILLIFVYIILSWIRLPYSPWLNRIQRFLYDVCEPWLRIFRRILPPLGPLDLSPIVAVFALVFINRGLRALLGQFD